MLMEPINCMGQQPRLYLEAGHGAADPGAVAGNVTEASLTTQLRNLITARLRQLSYKGCIIHDADNHNLSQVLRQFEPRRQDVLLSLHFNAGSPTATGVEALVASNATPVEIELAGLLAAATSAALQLPLRGQLQHYKGVKTETASKRGKLGILHEPCQAVLLEVCFLSNPQNLQQYRLQQAALVNRLCRVLLEHLAATTTT
jgi:N-acetylmuramoyl-L-alanine amidase